MKFRLSRVKGRIAKFGMDIEKRRKENDDLMCKND